jgi:hypothetical protein
VLSVRLDEAKAAAETAQHTAETAIDKVDTAIGKADAAHARLAAMQPVSLIAVVTLSTVFDCAHSGDPRTQVPATT